MPFNTFTVACSTTPTAIGTLFHHYWMSKEKRTAHPAKCQLSYHEGESRLKLEHASHHRVEDLQAFTSGYIPVAQWVHLTVSLIPHENIDKAATLLINYFGHRGISQIGGQKWWRWREKALKGEWIEMRSHFHARTRNPSSVPKRTLLYVHGGAYFFNSVAIERYQIQRHARKLNCRAFAPRYRLAPQYPFPCTILDVLSAYLYLLDTCHIPAGEILISGDSAGGGLVLGLLCLLRDMGVALPVGAMLISPWVDLMHSFPSIVESGSDYIPKWGFHHRPSLAWPPPTIEELERLRASWPAGSPVHLPGIDTLASETKIEMMEFKVLKERGGVQEEGENVRATETLTVEIDGKMVEVKDQIQMIAPNDMLDNPLLSPVTQASLGGLCPLLIIAGGGELLRDEIIYIAHKAAQPSKYPTSEVHLNKYPKQRCNVGNYSGTKVFLQVFDDCAHVTPTLSFTKPAKYMYRSIANFGIWCTSSPSSIQLTPTIFTKASTIQSTRIPKIRVTGSIPDFNDNMIRQRISTHGVIREMEPASQIPALNIQPEEICIIHPGPTKPWLTAKNIWDVKYAKQKRHVQLAREQEHIEAQKRGPPEGELAGETPPPSALAGRPSIQLSITEDHDEPHKKRKNLAGWMWARMGGKEDKEREEAKRPVVVEGVDHVTPTAGGL